MKDFGKKLKRFLLLKNEDIGPRLRKTLIGVHLVLIALLVPMCWVQAGCPLFTAEQEFRRMERTRLLPPGEIVFTAGEKGRDHLAVSGENRAVYEDYSVHALDGTGFHLRQGPWFAALGEEYAVLACVEREDWKKDLTAVPRDPNGATLLVFPAGYGYWFEEFQGGYGAGYEYHNFFPLLVLDAPEETASAEITVVQDGVSVTGPGWNMGNHVWLLTPDNQVLPYQSGSPKTFTLRLYREDGSLLLERNGTLQE